MGRRPIRTRSQSARCCAARTSSLWWRGVPMGPSGLYLNKWSYNYSRAGSGVNGQGPVLGCTQGRKSWEPEHGQKQSPEAACGRGRTARPTTTTRPFFNSPLKPATRPSAPMSDWGTARWLAFPDFKVVVRVVIRCALDPPGPPGGGAHRMGIRFKGRVTVRPPLRGYLN